MVILNFEFKIYSLQILCQEKCFYNERDHLGYRGGGRTVPLGSLLGDSRKQLDSKTVRFLS